VVRDEAELGGLTGVVTPRKAITPKWPQSVICLRSSVAMCELFLRSCG
jgi:hypothetical protein